MPSTQLHAGILFFSEATPRSDILAASKAFAELPALKDIWVRRFDGGRSWAIEFLATCNTYCRDHDIAHEVECWLQALEQWRHLIVARSVSQDVVLVKRSSLPRQTVP